MNIIRNSTKSVGTLSKFYNIKQAGVLARMMSSIADTLPQYKFETLLVTVPKQYVYHVELNRPRQSNAMNNTLWREVEKCFVALNDDSECRAVVLSGAGKLFCAGLDFTDMAKFAELNSSEEDIARKAKFMKQFVLKYQDSITSMEKCTKPVIAAVHNACIGAATSIISACDIRYCTADAWFSIKEVDIGITADVGVLQRMPKAVGNDSLIRELVYTARNMNAGEALQLGLVSRVLPTKEDLMASAFETASVIASKSPVAVQGSKLTLNYSRDHSVDEGLAHVAQWNMTMLLSEDVAKAAIAAATRAKEPPLFAKY